MVCKHAAAVATKMKKSLAQLVTLFLFCLSNRILLWLLLNFITSTWPLFLGFQFLCFIVWVLCYFSLYLGQILQTKTQHTYTHYFLPKKKTKFSSIIIIIMMTMMLMFWPKNIESVLHYSTAKEYWNVLPNHQFY